MGLRHRNGGADPQHDGAGDDRRRRSRSRWTLRSRTDRRATTVRPALSTWMFVAVLQGGIGYVQYFTGVPEILVGAHSPGRPRSGSSRCGCAAVVLARPFCRGGRARPRWIRSAVDSFHVASCSDMGTEPRRWTALTGVLAALGIMLLALLGSLICGRRAGSRPGGRGRSVDHRARAEPFRGRRWRAGHRAGARRAHRRRG